jgi:YegS/Rv2252/BmrU family lipid kinase
VAQTALRAANVQLLEENDKRPPDAIVVAGGDGSIARVIPEAIASGVPVGVIPCGTFNELARTLKLPFDVAAACATIARGETRTIDVARVNGVYYANEASIGASSRITWLQRSEEKQRLGWGAIIGSILLGLRYVRPFQATIECGDRTETLRTIQITVANSNRFGGIIDVHGAAIDDGLLDCYAIEAGGIFPIVPLVAAVIRHGAGGLRGLRAYRGTTIRLDAPRAHRIAADGEPAGTTPAAFEVLPKAIKIFVPES